MHKDDDSKIDHYNAAIDMHTLEKKNELLSR